jgi:CBS domain-containing protein
VASGRQGLLPRYADRETLEHAYADDRKDQSLKDLVGTLHVSHLHRDHVLHLALERMGKYHFYALPVVHREDTHKLKGIVTLQDVLDAYGVDGISGLSDSSH